MTPAAFPLLAMPCLFLHTMHIDFAPFSNRRRQLIVVATAGDAVATSLDLATSRLIFGADSPRGEFRLSFFFFLYTSQRNTVLSSPLSSSVIQSAYQSPASKKGPKAESGRKFSIFPSCQNIPSHSYLPEPAPSRFF